MMIDMTYYRWEHIPEELDVQDHKYSLLGITYGNGGHFNSSVRIQGQWYLYDGLREYHRKGTGLTKQSKAAPKPGYTKNNIVYIKNTI
jgi:ubiquitin C-terminal hydrolase